MHVVNEYNSVSLNSSGSALTDFSPDMSSLAVSSYFLVFSVTSAFAGQPQITITPRKNATLQCQSPRDAAIIVLEWTRSDLKAAYVFFYRNDRSYEKYQHPSFRGRVELRDPEMKEGDVSVILKNVTINDTGTYECRITISNTERFNNTISLKVKEPGGAAVDTWEGGKTDKIIKDGGNKDVNVGLVVGLLVFVVLLSFVAFMIIRKHKCVKESFYQQVSQRTVKQPEV